MGRLRMAGVQMQVTTQLRPYQAELAEQGHAILKKLGIVYYSIEMRVGKTHIALKTADLIGAKNVLFATKKKAISSIQSDFNDTDYNYQLKVTNFQQLHTINYYPDVVIIDEAHSIGAYPKPSQRFKMLQKICSRAFVMLLSGTPSPESYSQLYHQFAVSPFNLYSEYKSFYHWANKYVFIAKKYVNGSMVNDYSGNYNQKQLKLLEEELKYKISTEQAVTSSLLNKINIHSELAKQEKIKEQEIMQSCQHLFISYTQQEAGFAQHEVKEYIIEVNPDPRIYRLAKTICKDRVFTFKDGTAIVADSAVKVQNKLHQIYSGTVICDDGSRKVLDLTKTQYIRDNYQGKRIAIYYKFQAEADALRKVFNNITESPEEFNNSDGLIFISQIQAGSEGVNLSTADYLIMYNIDFSSKQYWQARARMQTLTRTKDAVVHWLFTKDGIEHKVYEAVLNKKDYTLNYFRKDYEV